MTTATDSSPDKPNQTVRKYGLDWKSDVPALWVELEMLRRGGEYRKKDKKFGSGLVFHYKEAIRILWPEVIQHRWFDFILERWLSHTYVGIVGPKNSGKTHCMAIFHLLSYYAFEDQTTILVCSTTREMLENRIFGELKKYHKLAKQRYDWLPGNLIEGRQRIVTDSRDEFSEGRDFRNGIIGIPLKKGGQLVGMSDIIGIKNKRKFLCGDELQCLPKSFLDGTANFLEPGADCKITGMGNPSDITDALGMLCEPHVTLGGWDGGIDQSPKTKSWKTRFDNGICIQLPGSDSPNFDVPEDQPVPYPFLMTKSQMEKDARTWGREDWHYLMFNEGRFPRGQGSRRIITRQLCLKNHALEDPVWLNSTRTYITALDAAYRAVGGDRCVLMRMAYGPESKSDIDAGTALAESLINQRQSQPTNRIIIALLDTIIVPIKSSDVESPEDQIVMFTKMQSEKWGIGPENHFFDAGMRTSLVSAYSRLWSPRVNTLDFGGKPSLRQVSHDIEQTCRDYYSKRVTEIWFNWRLAIESEQVRGMTEDLMQEGCLREWTLVAGNKIEAESKSDMREKCGRSPDLADCFCIGLWGAIEKGFVIRRLSEPDASTTDIRWKRELREKAKKVWHGSSLVHSV